jgi:hypothetical protein
MAEHEEIPNAQPVVEGTPVEKKPYQDPAFRWERVFETMALRCGKIDPTEFSCRFNRNAS